MKKVLAFFAAVITASTLMGAANAADGSWTLLDTNASANTRLWGISTTVDLTTPPLPISKITAAVDSLIVTSGTSVVTVTTLGSMAADIGGNNTAYLTAPSGTIVPTATITAAQRSSYTTITNKNRYAAIGYVLDVSGSAGASIYVTEFAGAAK